MGARTHLEIDIMNTKYSDGYRIVSADEQALAFLEDWIGYARELEAKHGLAPRAHDWDRIRGFRFLDQDENGSRYELLDGVHLVWKRCHSWGNVIETSGSEQQQAAARSQAAGVAGPEGPPALEPPAHPDTYCPAPYDQFVIQWNGDVVSCCTDYEGGTKTANVFTAGDRGGLAQRRAEAAPPGHARGPAPRRLRALRRREAGGEMARLKGRPGEPARTLGVLVKAHPWHGVPIGPEAPEVVTTFVELVPSDTVKYELDKLTGLLKIDRPQQYSNICPTPYGFIPQTLCAEEVGELCALRTGRRGIVGDGDPMDICLLTEKDITHGNVLVQAIPIGGLRMLDGSEADDKILAVLRDDAVYGELAGPLRLPGPPPRPAAPLLPHLQAVPRPLRHALRDHARLRPRGGLRGDPAQPRRLSPALRRVHGPARHRDRTRPPSRPRGSADEGGPGRVPAPWSASPEGALRSRASSRPSAGAIVAWRPVTMSGTKARPPGAAVFKPSWK